MWILNHKGVGVPNAWVVQGSYLLIPCGSMVTESNYNRSECNLSGRQLNMSRYLIIGEQLLSNLTWHSQRAQRHLKN